MPEETELNEWIAQINNLLYVNGSELSIEADDMDAELDWAIGLSPLSIAERLLGREIIVGPPPSRQEVEELKTAWLNDAERDVWDLFRIRRFRPYAEELRQFCHDNRMSTPIR